MVLGSEPLPIVKTENTLVLGAFDMPARLKVKFLFRMIPSSGTGVIQSHLGAALPRSMAERWLSHDVLVVDDFHP